jgi:hypothetical protein
LLSTALLKLSLLDPYKYEPSVPSFAQQQFLPCHQSQMVKIKQSGYKSTGDQAPQITLPGIDSTLQRILRPTPSRLISNADSSDDDDDGDDGDPSDVKMSSPLSSTPSSPTAASRIQTRSGKMPKKEHHEV